MQFRGIHIGSKSIEFLRKTLREGNSYVAVNRLITTAAGILDFFPNQDDLDEFRGFIPNASSVIVREERAEYGDFRTNLALAQKVVALLKSEGGSPTVLIEPTFGKGNFILAALHNLIGLKQILGFEIHKPYVWEAKFSILNFFMEHPDRAKPHIRLAHQDVFMVDFRKINKELAREEVLVLGNPPWVTNSVLGGLQSDNLPPKSNFKNLNGLDTITGKSNFDIGEYITLMLLRAFQGRSGRLALLLKNAVIKNLILEQKNALIRIGELRQIPIDAKQEFGASVEASLFVCKLNQVPALQCGISLFHPNAEPSIRFGWHHNRFVSNIDKYLKVGRYDGISPFEWRQGIKHDCASVMELERINGHFGTSSGQVVTLENDLVHGILKSSELKGGVLTSAKKYTIVTQKKVGQDTSYIQQLFPATFAYLDAHRTRLSERKSSIYRGKPSFSIFGIGDYSFMPYKVAVSGLYKTPSFTLVLPENGRPLMLDAPCYFLGFGNVGDAAIAFALLNHSIVLDAIAFPDAKRVYTKEVLMRIDLASIAAEVHFEDIKTFFDKYGLNDVVTETQFINFRESLHCNPQMQLF